MARRKRVSSEVCADLMRVETDAAAAERLGVRPGEMAVPIRDMELRNWLAQI